MTQVETKDKLHKAFSFIGSLLNEKPINEWLAELYDEYRHKPSFDLEFRMMNMFTVALKRILPDFEYDFVFDEDGSLVEVNLNGPTFTFRPWYTISKLVRFGEQDWIAVMEIAKQGSYKGL